MTRDKDMILLCVLIKRQDAHACYRPNKQNVLSLHESETQAAISHIPFPTVTEKQYVHFY